VSLEGRHVLITGATSGIGAAAALELAREGAELTLLCRNPGRAEAAADSLQAASGKRPDILLANMASLDEVRAAARQYVDAGRPLHVLLNNAGLINTRRRESVDGFEETLAVNHLAPFLLTGMLLPRMLDTGGRIVTVASNAHQFCRGMEFEDLQSERKYSTFNVYGRSKLANILFTRELARRLQGRPVTVNCLHPGAVATGMGTNNGGPMGKILPLLLKPFFRTPEKGAETAVFLCSDPSVAETSGGYFIDCRQVQPRPWACDDEAARTLWSVSESLTDFHYDAMEN